MSESFVAQIGKETGCCGWAESIPFQNVVHQSIVCITWFTQEGEENTIMHLNSVRFTASEILLLFSSFSAQLSLSAANITALLPSLMEGSPLPYHSL